MALKHAIGILKLTCEFCCLDSLLTNLEESIVFAEDVTSPSEDYAELEMDLERNTVTSHVRMKRVLLAMFDELCGWQEHVVLGTLMSGLANQMACRLVLLSKNFFALFVTYDHR